MSNIQRKQQLTSQQLQMVDSEFDKSKKEMLIAYLLWFFFGTFGAHRFYLGKTGTAIAQLILSITVIGLIVSGIWVLVDLFLVPGILRNKNEEIESEIIDKISLYTKTETVEQN